MDAPIKRETTQFLKCIKSAITNGENVKKHLNKLIPDIFNFRIKAIKWLIDETEADLRKIIDEVYPQLEELKSNLNQ